MGSGDQLPVTLLLVGAGFAVAWFVFFCLPTSYRITDDEVLVRRLGITFVRLSFGDIARARMLTWGDLLELSVTREKRLMRNCRWLTSYVRKLLVLEATSGRIYVLSPTNEQLSQLSKKLRLS